MKRPASLTIMILLLICGCKKDETPSTSGTVTIDNKTYQSGTYYVYGFSFSRAKKVTTLEDPGPDITLYVNQDNIPYRLILQANNLKPSFYKIGDYPDAQAAAAAYNNLKSVGSWVWSDMADPLSDNQVWVYRTGSDCYAKFRIISTVNEMRNNLPYGECTLEWSYQPDGSTTFPE